MKFPSHIILDVSKPLLHTSTHYWIFRYISKFNKKTFEFQNAVFYKKFLLQKENLIKADLFKKQHLYTVKYSYSNPSLFMKQSEKEFYKKTFEPKEKITHKDLFSKHFSQKTYEFLTNPTLFDEKSINRLFIQPDLKKKLTQSRVSNLWSLFDINFLKKEKIYTKLKYSRVPQYDIVSGGSAALLSGFLGFLISEKFGFEMVDSGDFYYLFMYFVFLSFSLRPFLRIVSEKTFDWAPFSFKVLFVFYKTIILLLFKSCKRTYTVLFK